MQLIVYLEIIALYMADVDAILPIAQFMADVDAILIGHLYRTQKQCLIGSLADVCRTLVYIFMKMANVPILCSIMNHSKNIRCAIFTYKVYGN